MMQALQAPLADSRTAAVTLQTALSLRCWPVTAWV